MCLKVDYQAWSEEDWDKEEEEQVVLHMKIGERERNNGEVRLKKRDAERVLNMQIGERGGPDVLTTTILRRQLTLSRKLHHRTQPVMLTQDIAQSYTASSP